MIDSPVNVDPMVPPVLLKLLLTASVPVPFNVPLFTLSAAMEVGPFKDNVPPDTDSVPPPLVAPEIASEPPVTSNELPVLMVRAAILSVSLLWVTA